MVGEGCSGGRLRVGREGTVHSIQDTARQDHSTENGPALAYRMPPAHDEVVREILIPFLYRWVWRSRAAPLMGHVGNTQGT